MDNNNKTSSGGQFITALILFVITASVALILLLTALIVWLSELLGSLIAASLLLAGFFAVLTYVIYLLSIRDGVKRLRERLDTVYEVALTVKEGYRWISDKFLFLMRLLDRKDEDSDDEKCC